jgi:DNA replication protein DnaC
MIRRYERTFTVLISNKSYKECGEVFGDEVMAAALIDRVLQHCHIVNIRGNSYRMRQHTELCQSLKANSEDSTTARSRRKAKEARAP